ncbi:RICIN domain-containing protein [Streptomyces sp. NBC_00234]|uniref:RICIN domain-containing protein n=1 Tax=Streptomyces sp. NBC_00234 TaxID=2903638 RepID=UPI002E29C565|nr:RICIN domain-containing protein [Streptomyces sp. NBC_00234]
MACARPDDVVVHEPTPATGRTVDTTIRANTALEGAPNDVSFTGTGSFRLHNVHSGKVLDNPGASRTDGQPMDQWADTDSPNQWWKLVPAGTGGHFNLVNGSSGLCLDVEAASTEDGARIVQMPADGAAGQEWVIVGL